VLIAQNSSRRRPWAGPNFFAASVSTYGLGVLVDLFDFLATLPEHEIGADRGSKNGNYDGQAVRRERKSWRDKAKSSFLPIYFHDENDGYISQQYQRQPLEISGVALVGNEKLKGQRGKRKGDGEDVSSPSEPSSAAAPMTARFAPMLIVLAINSSPIRSTSGFGKTSPMFFASPQPVTLPIWALTS
jgi:hypothetical protein